MKRDRYAWLLAALIFGALGWRAIAILSGAVLIDVIVGYAMRNRE